MQKTWVTVHFMEGSVEIEADFNYETKAFSLSHGSNDDNVTFNSKDGDSIKSCFDRARCVIAALKYIKSELQLSTKKVKTKKK